MSCDCHVTRSPHSQQHFCSGEEVSRSSATADGRGPSCTAFSSVSSSSSSPSLPPPPLPPPPPPPPPPHSPTPPQTPHRMGHLPRPGMEGDSQRELRNRVNNT